MKKNGNKIGHKKIRKQKYQKNQNIKKTQIFLNNFMKHFKKKIIKFKKLFKEKLFIKIMTS